MKTETVTLTSGRKVEIKPLGVLGYRNMHGVLPDMIEASAESIPKGVALDALIQLVCSCAVEPRFCDDAGQAGPAGALSIDELELTEVVELGNAIAKISDIKVEAISNL